MQKNIKWYFHIILGWKTFLKGTGWIQWGKCHFLFLTTILACWFQFPPVQLLAFNKNWVRPDLLLGAFHTRDSTIWSSRDHQGCSATPWGLPDDVCCWDNHRALTALTTQIQPASSLLLRASFFHYVCPLLWRVGFLVSWCSKKKRVVPSSQLLPSLKENFRHQPPDGQSSTMGNSWVGETFDLFAAELRKVFFLV